MSKPDWREMMPPDFFERAKFDANHFFWSTLCADALDGEREYWLSDDHRVDVFVPETGEVLEIKTSAEEIEPTINQVLEYQSYDEVEAVILGVPPYLADHYRPSCKRHDIDLIVLDNGGEENAGA